MRIKKMFQGTIPENKIVGTYSTSSTDAYNCQYINEHVANTMYPVGSIYISVNNTNPSTYFGGTWVAFGTGKTLVGIDTSQTEFNTVEKTGGEKTHTLSEAEMPAHSHSGTTDGNGNHAHQVGGDWDVSPGGNYTSVHNAGYPGNSTNPWTSTNGWHDHTFTTNSKGSGSAHNNLQPYIIVYMWKRTA